MQKPPSSFDPLDATRLGIVSPSLIMRAEDTIRPSRTRLETAAERRDRLAAQQTPDLPTRIA